MVTTTLPSSCILYTGAGKPPSPSERPFRSKAPFHPTPVVFPVSEFPAVLPCSPAPVSAFPLFPIFEPFPKAPAILLAATCAASRSASARFSASVFSGFFSGSTFFSGSFCGVFFSVFFRGFFSFLGFSFFGSSFFTCKEGSSACVIKGCFTSGSAGIDSGSGAEAGGCGNTSTSVIVYGSASP